MNTWNNIYSHFSPIAFEIFGFSIHWYGLAYITALLLGFGIAKYFANTNQRFKNISSNLLDSYFIWIEVGIVLGARFGYLFIYTDDFIYYIIKPWQAFNPYVNGEFVGIAGMSFHGAVLGFLIASFLFYRFKKLSKTTACELLDLAAISMPLGYVFGRIGNFLNKELYGREIEQEWLKGIGIYVDGALRYPSQLIEAFLEGIVVFLIVYFFLYKAKTKGMLMVIYALSYAAARFLAEYSREADSQMGYYFLHLSMGQILSIIMMIFAILLWWYIYPSKKVNTMNNKTNK
ncbi:prolipoprotein diacylglyceryl transferase [Helicobacter muridarum]|uniref:Phosphatidylglycerol--prolipoprotein diacylglyceryl transferase n=1 Tax=Helicobacter muridarum TaxID=216 RepID=A0A099TXA5_9HELI|nr:prolipoprotein diacylglyceryl transferase [Helicobacter muridarum]TLE00215.1 prolipoprotein diacylglyceryl transferase [Helicobacter muridarum]STQ85702.1 prolipoprotein diacylglyceryl transferase [Helicobacter muridarum]